MCDYEIMLLCARVDMTAKVSVIRNARVDVNKRTSVVDVSTREYEHLATSVHE